MLFVLLPGVCGIECSTNAGTNSKKLALLLADARQGIGCPAARTDTVVLLAAKGGAMQLSCASESQAAATGTVGAAGRELEANKHSTARQFVGISAASGVVAVVLPGSQQHP